MSPRSARSEWCRIDIARGRNGAVGGRRRHVEGIIRSDVDERTDLRGDKDMIVRAKEEWTRWKSVINMTGRYWLTEKKEAISY